MKQIVASCHRPWGNRVGDTACAMWSDRGVMPQIMGNREGHSRCGDDRGLVPQIMGTP